VNKTGITISYKEIKEGDYIETDKQKLIFKLADDNNVPRNTDEKCYYKDIKAPIPTRQLAELILD
jgi:DNA-binding transcriptional regulator YhcF (GntR family)